MKCYAVIWTGPERQKMIDALDKIPEILNWRAASGAIFIVSEQNEDWLAEKIHKEFPSIIFMVAPVKSVDVQGYQDKTTWEFIQNPRRA
jgi:hypothetical protein